MRYSASRPAAAPRRLTLSAGLMRVLAVVFALASAAASEPLAAQGEQRAQARAQAELDAAGQRYAPAIRHCYQEGGLKENPALRGQLRVAVMVLPAGSVRHPTVSASKVHGSGMENVVECVQALAGSWHFNNGAFRAQRVVLLFDLIPLTS
ncbi:MAG: hypothetical protein ACJ79K_16995 [Gemmatimonadaceae bacterium]